MKKLVRFILIGSASVISADLSIADPAPIIPSSTETTLNIAPEFKLAEKDKTPIAKSAFFYFRFAAAEKEMDSVLPGLGIGYRRLAGNGAADISINGIGRAQKRNDCFFWSAPKASYIHYLQPNKQRSFYAGGGLAWGGFASKTQSFIGIIPSLTGGYEFLRKNTVLGFTELNISQPALAVYKEGTSPGPIVEYTVGMGF